LDQAFALSFLITTFLLEAVFKNKKNREKERKKKKERERSKRRHPHHTSSP
jgi:hypothetical protein